MHDKWDRFVKENVLHNDIIDGVLLITKNLEAVYRYGALQGVPSEQFSQFNDFFQCQHSESGKSQVLVNGFRLDIGANRMKFIIRKSQHHSVYAVTKGNKMGVVVVNVPFGILVVSHSYPVMSNVAAQHVEDICILLRS